MLVLLLGLILFLGVHGLTMFRQTRAELIVRYGEGRFKGIYSLVAGLGFVLIIWGFHLYRANGLIPVWSPPGWTRHITMILMLLAFIAMAAMARKPSRIRGWLRHPMLAAIMLWAVAHLLVNGDAGGMALFGAFLIWAAIDRVAVNVRGDVGALRIDAFTRSDAIAVGAGVIAYVAMLFLHPWLIGVAVIGG
jgi:uncharacterized membrane protein